jgi:hypothetical protein
VFFDGELPVSLVDLQYDIEEAAKCYALRRNTACVYHFMKVMEGLVRKLAVAAGTVVGQSVAVLKPNGEFKDWGGILSALKSDAIDLMDKRNMAAEHQQWSGIHMLLYSVKEAWRNPTMHPASKYTDEETEEVFSTVRILIRRLASVI